MSTVKKLFLITQHYPYGNGEKTFIEPELKVLLDTKKFDVTIICNSVTQNKVLSEIDSRVKVINIPLKSLFKRPVNMFTGFCKFWLSEIGREELSQIRKSGHKVIKKFIDSVYNFVQAEIFYKEICKYNISFDNAIVYTYWFNTQALTFSLYKNKWKSIRFVSRIHGFDLYNERTSGGRQPFRWFMDQRVDTLYFIAESGLEYYKTHFSISSEDKYIVNRLGTFCIQEYERVKQKQRKRDKFCMVSCSSLIPLKRVQYVIQALEHISDIEIEWIHFGDGNERSKLEQLAEQLLGTKWNIHFEFRGATDNTEIQRFYLENKVDCFITTSSTEGCPVSIQEALSYGIPIIATNVGEIPVMVQRNGILLEQDMKIMDISNAIREIYAMPEEDKERTREISRNLWEQYFDANRNYNLFAESLLEV